MQARVAGALRARGLREGDRAAFLCPNSVELLCGILGAARAGIAPVPLNPALLESERATILDDAEPALIVDHAVLDDLVQGPPVDLAPAPLVRPMHYTSGTTGRPKGVWSGVFTEEEAIAFQADEDDVWGFEQSDVMLVCSPLYHSAPLRFSLGTLLAGGEVVVLERFDVETVAHTITELRPTLTFMVPSHLQRLFAHDAIPDLSSFRRLVHAGAPCPSPIKRAALDAFPPGILWEFYGATEGQFTV